MIYKLNNGVILKAQRGKPSYQNWLKTVNPVFIDKNYDLETAYDNLPFDLLEAWRKDPENNHLPSGIELQNGNWQYLKSPLHKSWFLNNAWEMTKEGKAWKQKYIGDKKFPFETLILKGQHGILTPWYKVYNSKLGEAVRNFMFGKDSDLSDEEYVQKYGYAKPITGTGMLPSKTSMNIFESIEGPLVKGSFGTGAKYNSGLQAMKTKAASKLVEPKTVSNWDKFLKKSLDEQNKIVKYWDERYSTMRQLQANQKQFKRFVNWINKQ